MVSSDPDIPPPQRPEAPGPRTGYMGTLHIYNDYRDIFCRFTQYFQFAILAQDVMEPLESPRILCLFLFFDSYSSSPVVAIRVAALAGHIDHEHHPALEPAEVHLGGELILAIPRVLPCHPATCSPWMVVATRL